MPELAEVETARLRLEKALKGQSISEVQIDAEDKFFLAGTSAATVRKALEGAKVTGSGRKGKYFWIALNRRPWPLIHLGMTGNVEIKRAGKGKQQQHGWGGVKMWSERNRAPAPGGIPFFTRLRMIAKNGTEVVITDPRRFGRLWLAEDPVNHPRVKKLGFDPLQDFPSAKELAKVLAKRKAPIKAVLLDQKIFAGVGNWLADEILFQAALAPARKASSLTKKEISKLRSKVLSVVKKAVAVEADYDRFPKSWLFHHRWGKNTKAVTQAKQKIIHEEIGGRTTAWVPSVQR